jgi:hypothetical protein
MAMKPKAAKKAMPKGAGDAKPKPKFGSPEFRAMYNSGKKAKKGK